MIDVKIFWSQIPWKYKALTGHCLFVCLVAFICLIIHPSLPGWLEIEKTLLGNPTWNYLEVITCQTNLSSSIQIRSHVPVRIERPWEFVVGDSSDSHDWPACPWYPSSPVWVCLLVLKSPGYLNWDLGN